MLEEVENSLDSQKAVWLLFLAYSLHEDRQVMVVVQLFHFNLPLDRVRRTVLNLDRQITTIVEAAEL